MYLTLETFEKKAEDFLRSPKPQGPVNLLPGPVAVHKVARKVFERTPESHRSDAFLAEFQKARERLCRLVGARHVEILMGSGTLANDTVAAQLTLETKPGLILSNGEFGERLVDQASRFGLTFDTLKFPWGQTFDLSAIQQFLSRSPAIGWVWFVHNETSTGMLNPLPALQSLCSRAKVKLCADCISSIGMVPVDLKDIHLATCASGKALAGYPGLCMVFYNHSISPSPRLPRYLDLGWSAKHNGIAFTHSSNLVLSLDAAVQNIDFPKKFAALAEVSNWLRHSLREIGFDLVTADSDATPGIITIALPTGTSSTQLGRDLIHAGFLLSYNSDYLRQRNWIQICLMGEYIREKLQLLLTELKKASPVRESTFK